MPNKREPECVWFFISTKQLFRKSGTIQFRLRIVLIPVGFWSRMIVTQYLWGSAWGWRWCPSLWGERPRCCPCWRCPGRGSGTPPPLPHSAGYIYQSSGLLLFNGTVARVWDERNGICLDRAYIYGMRFWWFAMFSIFKLNICGIPQKNVRVHTTEAVLLIFRNILRN